MPVFLQGNTWDPVEGGVGCVLVKVPGLWSVGYPDSCPLL